MIRDAWMGLVCMIPLPSPDPDRPLVLLVPVRGNDRGYDAHQQSPPQVSPSRSHTVTLIVLNGLRAAGY